MKKFPTKMKRKIGAPQGRLLYGAPKGARILPYSVLVNIDKQFKWSRVEVTVFPRAKQLLTKRRKTKNCSSNVQNERKKTRPIRVHCNKVWLNFLIGFTKCEKKLSAKLWSWNCWRTQPKENRKLCRYHFLVNSLLHFYNSRILKQKVLLQKIMFVKN